MVYWLEACIPLFVFSGITNPVVSTGYLYLERFIMLDVFLDALIDSLKTLPFLFAAYFLIEYLEHRASSKMERGLQKLGKFGPIGGSLLGVVPQCGFSLWRQQISTPDASSQSAHCSPCSFPQAMKPCRFCSHTRSRCSTFCRCCSQSRLRHRVRLSGRPHFTALFPP